MTIPKVLTVCAKMDCLNGSLEVTSVKIIYSEFFFIHYLQDVVNTERLIADSVLFTIILLFIQ